MQRSGPKLKVYEGWWLGQRIVELADNMASNVLGSEFPQNSIDALPLRDVRPDSIDREKVITHLAEARSRGRYSGPDDPDEYLALRKCVAELDG